MSSPSSSPATARRPPPLGRRDHATTPKAAETARAASETTPTRPPAAAAAAASASPSLNTPPHQQQQQQQATPVSRSLVIPSPPQQQHQHNHNNSPHAPSLRVGTTAQLHHPQHQQQQQQQNGSLRRQPTPTLSFADRLSQLAVSGVSSKEHKHAIIFPPTRVPPSLFLYKQSASQLSFAPPSQSLIVSASSSNNNNNGDGSPLAADTSMASSAPAGSFVTSGGKLPPLSPQTNRKRWLPAEHPSGFDRMEMRYLAQVFDKLVNRGEVADACVPTERARRILNLAADGSSECAPEDAVVAAAPAESAHRLAQKMEGLLIGLHEVARLTAPASQDLTAIATMAVDEVRTVMYELLQHVQVQKQEARREKLLRVQMEGVAEKLRKELDDLTAEVEKLSTRMTQHYEVKPEYLKNRENAPKIKLPEHHSVEELAAKERRAYDTYVPAQNKSLHNTFVENVLTTATPGVRDVTNFGREQQQQQRQQGEEGGESPFAAQSNAIMVSSERACRLPPGVSGTIKRRHPPITKDVAVDCTDLYWFGHSLVGGGGGGGGGESQTNKDRAGSFSSTTGGGSSPNLDAIRRRQSVAFPSHLNLLTRSSGDSASIGGGSATSDADNLFNFALPAPKLYAHSGALFIQPVARLFQAASTIQGRESQVLGTTMTAFAGTGSVEKGKTGFAQVGDLTPSAVKILPSSLPSPERARPSNVALSGVNVPSSDDEQDSPAAPSLTVAGCGGAGSGGGGNTRSASPSSPKRNKAQNNSSSKSGKGPRGMRKRRGSTTAGGASAGALSPSVSLVHEASAGAMSSEGNLSERADSPTTAAAGASSGSTLSPRASVDYTASFRNAFSGSAAGAATAEAAAASGSPTDEMRRSSKAALGSMSGGGFRRVGNAVVSLIRKRQHAQGSAINQAAAETQTDPWRGVDAECQTAAARDIFGMKIGSHHGSPGGSSTSGRGKHGRKAALRDGTARKESFGKGHRGANSSSREAGSPNAGSPLGGSNGTSVTDIGNVLAGFQDELGISGAGPLKRRNEDGSAPAADDGTGGNDKKQLKTSAVDLDEEALLEATGFGRVHVDLTADAITNTDVTLSGVHLHKLPLLDAIVACNVRHFDGVVARKFPDYAVVPKELLEAEKRRERNAQQQKEENGDDSDGQGKNAEDDDANVEQQEKKRKEEQEYLDNENPWGSAGNASFIGGSMLDVINQASTSSGSGLAVTSGALGRSRADSIFGADGGSNNNSANNSPTNKSFASIAGRVLGSVANRKQQRTMHSHTILYAKSLPPLWRAELGQRPNFSGARIKARDWTLSVVLECFRSIDLLMVCATRPFPVNVVEFVQSKFGERKQARPYLLDLLVNAKVQSLSSMRCFAFVQLSELAGFAGIDDLPDVRSSSAFLFYYLFVTQRLQRTLSFRGIREFAHGNLVLNREAVVALLDAHLCHVAASFASAAEWEAERRRYYSALLSLKRLTADELSVVKYMQTMPCVVDGTKCEEPAPLVQRAAAAMDNDTDVWRKLEGLNTLVPLHADVVIYLVVRNHDALVELVVERARVLHVELAERYGSEMRPALVSTEEGSHPFEANVLPPPPMIAQQLLPVATPVAVPVHPLIAEMGTNLKLKE